MERRRNERGRYVEQVTLEDVQDVLVDADEPLTATEVGETLDITNRAALDKLDELRESGDVNRKRVGASAVVWWVEDAPPGDDRTAVEERPTREVLDTLEAFVEEGDAPTPPLPSAEAVREDYHARRHRENLERLAREDR